MARSTALHRWPDRPRRPGSTGKILILPYPGIGDAILHGPLLQELNREFPRRLLYPENPAFTLFQELGTAELDEITLVPRRIRRLLDWDEHLLLAELKRLDVKTVLNLRRDRVKFGSRYQRAADIVGRAGVAISDVCEAVSLTYQGSVHTSQLLTDYFRSMNVNVEPPHFGWLRTGCSLPAPAFPVPPAAIAYFVGASQETKRLPLDFWLKVIKRITALSGRPALVMGGASEEELVFGRRLSAGLAVGETPHELVVGRSLPELASIAGRVSLIVSCDTFMVHLAEAVGTPVIGIYCSTDPRMYGPFHSPDYVDGKFRSVCPLRNTIGNCDGWDVGCPQMSCKAFVRDEALVTLAMQKLGHE